MAVNDFLPFCPTDTGSNLLSESDYLAATDRTSGNKPGVASAKLNNKALRQGTAISTVVAQYVSDKTVTDVLDDNIPAKLLAQMNAAFKALPQVFTKYTANGSHNLSYVFFIATGNATAAATYTNNGITYTVSGTVASGLQITMTGSGAPTKSGTLTKASGTGDTTLTFYAMRAPAYLRVKLVGGGGGGGGSGVGSAGTGGTGGTTSFGTSLLSATGGTGGAYQSGIGGNGTGGTNTITAPALDFGSFPGNSGSGGGSYGGGVGGSFYGNGSTGGTSPWGGWGLGGLTAQGGDALVNSGSGGGGGGMAATVNMWGGGGGASGGFIDSMIPTPTGAYTVVIGARGTVGAAGGGGGFAGGQGGSGLVQVIEFF